MELFSGAIPMSTRQPHVPGRPKDRAGIFAAAAAWPAILVSIFVCGPPGVQGAQGVSSGGLKPFVIAVIPVVGRSGAVGGVAIDARGVLDRGTRETTGQLRRAWLAAMVPAQGEMARASALRKVSLRRLEAAIADCRDQGKPLPLEVQFLAGLQRVRYILAYPEAQDIVLAGEAGPWTLNDTGEVVGQASGQPILQLDDLIVALRTAEAASEGPGITCSFDPTEEGLARFDQLMRRQDLTMSEAAVRRLERALGDSVITVTGVDADTHFAQVLVVADWTMKRLAMGFDPAPTDELPSYLQLLQAGDRVPPRNAILRFWLVPQYDAVLRDPEGLAWELVGNGVQALTEAGLLAGQGRVADAGRPDPLAQQWTDSFTRQYSLLAAKLPVFASLRNCIDLAVVAAIANREQLLQRTNWAASSLLLSADQLDVGRYPVPRTTPSRASYVERQSEYVVSISGGVDLDSWSVLKPAAVRRPLAALRAASAPPRSKTWWWD